MTLRLSPGSLPAALLVAALCANAICAQDAPSEESAAIKKTALDYIEGWYSADAARMERALHPDLAKRIVRTNPGTSQSVLQNQTAEMLVRFTKAGGGSRTPAGKQMKEVTVLDRFENAAVVKIVASDWIDYLQVAKFNGEWKIINVLWEMKPVKKDAGR